MNSVTFWVFCCTIFIPLFMGIALLIVIAIIFYREYKKSKSITKAVKKLQEELGK